MKFLYPSILIKTLVELIVVIILVQLDYLKWLLLHFITVLIVTAKILVYKTCSKYNLRVISKCSKFLKDLDWNDSDRFPGRFAWRLAMPSERSWPVLSKLDFLPSSNLVSHLSLWLSTNQTGLAPLWQSSALLSADWPLVLSVSCLWEITFDVAETRVRSVR